MTKQLKTRETCGIVSAFMLNRSRNLPGQLPSPIPTIRQASRLSTRGAQLNMSRKMLPRPTSPLLVSLKGKEERHEDIARIGQAISKTSTSRNFFVLAKKFMVVVLCFTLVQISIQFFKGDMNNKHTASEDNFDLATTGSRADWNGEIPQFCKRIIANPKPQQSACKRDPKTFNCLDSGELIMFSQFKQDYYFYTKHFSKLKRPGVYLDVAANDPFHYSNTYFMDRCLGWKGVCVEGNPVYHEKLYRERSCHIVPTCVGRRDGEFVMFALGGGSGGVVGETFKNAETFAKQNKTVATIRERCTTMRTILSRNNIVTADYLSLDVEGHELEVLKGFDWEKVKINVISIETSPDTRNNIERFMTERGYKKHHPQLDERSIRSGLIKEDMIFLHEDVVFGSPV